jgi:splicing factor 3A subunit 3
VGRTDERMVLFCPQQKKEQMFNPDEEEEFEDSEGRVMNRKVYQDLKRQGLL